MAGSEPLSPGVLEIDPLDINEFLNQDEEVLYRSPSRGKAQLVDSDSDQLNGEDEEDLEDDGDSEEDEAEEEARTFYHNLDDEESLDEARPPSPLPSPNPYTHPPISDQELDFEWDEDKEVREAVKAKARKKAGKLACVGLSSTATNAEIKWCLKYFDKGCIWARPHPWMRPHIFDYNPRLRIPRMVLTPKLVKLGIGPPLHPYFKSIIEWFDIASIQLSPNS